MELKALSTRTGVPLIATNDVLYHAPEQRDLQDILTCIREGVTIENAGLLVEANAERHLKTPAEMARLYTDAPEAIAETGVFLESLDFSLAELRYQYPEEPIPPGHTPQTWLEELTWRHAGIRYPDGVPEKVQKLLHDELSLIKDLDYACYFLTIKDIVRVAEDKGILCQGRGSAANSAVCYVLGITAVDPAENELLFARFLSKERKEPPDIDVDFEHERREEVIQHIYTLYGRERAGIAATVISYRPKSAIREVGKALGLTEDITARLASTVWGSWSKARLPDDHIREAGLDPSNPAIMRAVSLTTRLLGFPRHLSQHVGGFILTQGRLDEYVPIGNAAMADRTFIEWDKDDIDRLGMMKVDVLALGMLTAIRKSFELIHHHYGKTYDLATVPQEDAAVYDMLCRGESIGVFQVESRAQINMLPRLQPREFYDLVIQVAIVRPGPIQGNMVHPYLRRRNGEEDVDFPSPAPPHDPDELRKVLSRTLGVPLFQEQAMSLAVEAAGFTGDEADQLRRAMAAWKRKGDRLLSFEDKFIGGMIERGYQRDFAERCFKQLRGFSEYGFPESHAASFAHLVYVSCWLKKHHPAAFAAALINSQPMGFYAPAQIVRDAQDHGVEVRPVDVNHSAWDCTLESNEVTALRSDEVSDPLRHTVIPSLRHSSRSALRLGMRLVKGLREDHATEITNAVEIHGPFASIESLHRAARVPVSALRKLASADAFNSMGLDRQHALWQIRSLRDEALPLFDAQSNEVTQLRSNEASGSLRHVVTPSLRHSPRPFVPSFLPTITAPSRVLHDYATLGLSLKAHPISFLRDDLTARGVTRACELDDETLWPHGRRIAVAGVVLVRQRPATASGIIFITLEDETGIANLIVRPHIYQRYRRAARHATILLATGAVERQGRVVHILTDSLAMLDEQFTALIARSRDFR
jgi:error-prone DNA polymerase